MHDKERGKTMKINEPKTPYVDSLSDVNCVITQIKLVYRKILRSLKQKLINLIPLTMLQEKILLLISQSSYLSDLHLEK